MQSALLAVVDIIVMPRHFFFTTMFRHFLIVLKHSDGQVCTKVYDPCTVDPVGCMYRAIWVPDLTDTFPQYVLFFYICTISEDFYALSITVSQ